ncbi:MAG: MFS transporter [Desulfobacteraceae bacterium]|nr:MFS transporter [Desulfobacteraceae bacterium]
MNQHRQHRPSRYRWAIFAVLALAYLFVYFHRLSLSVVADDLVKAFNTSAGTMGLLGSIYFYCYAAMQLPAGLLSDSIGPRKTVTTFLLIASIGSIVFGLAPNIKIAFLGRILVGFGVSMVFIPTMKILSQWFRKQEFASMAGILTAVGGAGVMAGTWLLAKMTVLVGWRISFELIGMFTLVLMVLAWAIVRDKPQDKGWAPITAENGNPAPVVGQTDTRASLLKGLQSVFTEKYFWPVAIWFFFDCGIFFGFGGLWAGPYLMHVYGMTHEQMGAILSMIAWGMIIGSPFLGYLSDKVFKSRKKPFIICSGTLTLVMLLFYLVPAGFSRPVLYLLFFLFSVCSSAIVIMGFTTAKELFPVNIAGTSVGAVNLFPFAGGACFMPLLGKVLDFYPKTAAGNYAVEGYTTLLLVLLIASVGALVCTFMMKETFQN